EDGQLRFHGDVPFCRFLDEREVVVLRFESVSIVEGFAFCSETTFFPDDDGDVGAAGPKPRLGIYPQTPSSLCA
ncbi:MAG: hypothetical protein SO155_12890, partial [Candidatus Ventricola sp.]|nr:hypothetical protein [Candidatus Ventricola sp.]